MAIELFPVNICDMCAHRWLSVAKPKRCSKCKSARWNHIESESPDTANGILARENLSKPSKFGIAYQQGADKFVGLKREHGMPPNMLDGSWESAQKPKTKTRRKPFKKNREYESAFVTFGRVIDEEQPKLRAALEPHHPRCTCWTCKPPKS